MKTLSNYTIYCTEEQTKKALALGAPIITTTEHLYNHPHLYEFWVKVEIQGNHYAAKIPTAEQMINWMRKDMKVAVSVDYNIQDNKAVWFYSIYSFAYSNPFAEPEDATLAAIDAALNYLNENKDNYEFKETMLR